MFRFNIQEEKYKDLPVPFEDLDVGDTFMYYAAYEDAGLDTYINLVFIKSSPNSAICISGSQRGYTHCIPPDTNMVEVDLEVTNITLKKEK
ncbi:hypothetical protein ECO340P2_00085 [Escherichia phage ECO340P2]|nr:hypothetical protein ECO340P2_00085 [Escherichia phage ECO340P2]